MKALLYKDSFVLLKNSRAFLLMIVIFAVIGAMNMMVFALLFSVLMPVTALAYDERAGWGQYAAAMPYSRRELVQSKYVLGILSLVFTSLLASVANGILLLLGRSHDSNLVLLPLFFFIAILMLSLMLPPMFKLGVERGRGVYYCLLVFVAILSAACANILFAVPKLPILPLTGIVAVLAIIGLVVSIRLSQTFYHP